MQKSLGIAALAISIIAIFIPFLGTWMTVLVAALAAFAYGPGLSMATAAIVIDIFHISCPRFSGRPAVWRRYPMRWQNQLARQVPKARRRSWRSRGFSSRFRSALWCCS